MSDRSETTGPHPVLIERRDGVALVNTRNVLLALAFLGGGGVTGIGGNMLRQPVPQEVIEGIAEAKTAADEARTSSRNVEATLADVRLTLVKIQSDLSARATQSAANADALKDHEQRIRVLERRMPGRNER